MSARQKQWKNQSAFFSKRRAKQSGYIALERSVVDEDGDDGILFVYSEDATANEVNQWRKERHPKPLPKQQSFLERAVQHNDTLANLALRYGCSVAELKRINNFLSDQELHGVRKIKVPIKPYSLLLDLEETTDYNKAARSNCISEVHELSIGSSLLPEDGRSFLRAMDEDLERIRKSTCHYKASLEDVTAELTCKRFHPISQQHWTTTKTNRQYRYCAILSIIVMTIVIPLLIFLYVHFYDAFEN